jgi:predicted ArsR family transcriptional regulator
VTRDKVKAQVLAEIMALAGKQYRQPGDVSIRDLREEWNVQDNTVKAWMEKLVKEGVYTSHMVYDPEVGRSCRIWRRVKPIETDTAGA